MHDDDLPDDAEIVGTFGNTYLIEEDGEQYSVARTTAYELAYVHGQADLVFGDAQTPASVFEGPPEVRVDPTDSDRVYTLQVDDGRPVQNPPGQTERVLAGVLEIVETGNPDTLVHLYEDLLEQQVDHELLEKVQRRYAPVPPASVQTTDDGWVIEDLFLLTWHASVYLVTRRFDGSTYRISGGITRTDEDVEFIGLTPGGEPEPVDVEIGGETLDEREMEFLWKAYWLATYRERYDDDLFWDLIERHVQETRARAQSTT